MMICVDGQWSLDFDQFGGYDCISAAYRIEYRGNTMIEIDVRHFTNREAMDKRNELAEEVARVCYDALIHNVDLNAALESRIHRR